jgi:glucose-6-phosphate isomerase
MPIESNEAAVRFDPSGRLTGPVTHQTRTLGQLQGVFADESARSEMPQDTVVYRVDAYMPVEEGADGGLFFGTSFLEPGVVGDEYFMTRGHFHQHRDAGEMYWGISGEGCLVLMDESGESRVEIVRPGSLHYVPGRTAHRLANTGSKSLVVGACWPSDAGHDYDSLVPDGFTALVKCVDGEPTVIDRDDG